MSRHPIKSARLTASGGHLLVRLRHAPRNALDDATPRDLLRAAQAAGRVLAGVDLATAWRVYQTARRGRRAPSEWPALAILWTRARRAAEDALHAYRPEPHPRVAVVLEYWQSLDESLKAEARRS